MKVISAEEFNENVKVDGQVMVKFFSPTCVPCRMIDNVLKTIDEVPIVAIDTTKAPFLVIDYNIMGVPTVIVFENGKEKSRKVGFQKKELLLEML